MDCEFHGAAHVLGFELSRHDNRYLVDGFCLAAQSGIVACGLQAFGTTGAELVPSRSRTEELNGIICRGCLCRFRKQHSSHGRGTVWHIIYNDCSMVLLRHFEEIQWTQGCLQGHTQPSTWHCSRWLPLRKAQAFNAMASSP